jgi:hypothetical protein
VRLRLLLLAIVVPGTGCLWTPRPYASDPLIHHRRATVGEFPQSAIPAPIAEPRPPDENE